MDTSTLAYLNSRWFKDIAQFAWSSPLSSSKVWLLDPRFFVPTWKNIKFPTFWCASRHLTPRMDASTSQYRKQSQNQNSWTFPESNPGAQATKTNPFRVFSEIYRFSQVTTCLVWSSTALGPLWRLWLSRKAQTYAILLIQLRIWRAVASRVT